MNRMRTPAKRVAKRELSLRWDVVGVVAVVAIAAGGVVWARFSAPPTDTTVASTASSAADLGEKKPIDWNTPIHGTTVASNDEAAAHVSFAPVVPAAIGNPVRIMVDDPSADHAGKTVAWVYQHPRYGRFFVIEGVTAWTQTSLQTLATCDPAKGCEGQRALVALANGATGVLVTGGPTTGIIWLWHGLTFDVYGPIDTFSNNSAMAVAESI